MQQRAHSITTQPPGDILWRSVQVKHRAAFTQGHPIFWFEHRAAARGNHRGLGRLQQGAQHLCLNLPKSGLAVLGKIIFDAAAQALFNGVVGIDKHPAALARHLPPNG